ncbi:hypothetical protein H310_06853 [Aphanomyces invadans]|uniref:Uncharacterized protein n=1 Tax=Aphanomyces invadans TaxID=157072 RepID=A0A024U6P0_9STRA|nr:hypothetical protein H310_06853 [Aphanomyces invadans]ETW01283.1 hypothetical protein H310_06853 [Aphanomyces invadans]|eukprot:XP_008870281.1 hypothetical protein H310_06853 [Aphanomyces invadans]
MTTGLTLQHLYSQQYTQPTSSASNPALSSMSSSHNSGSGPNSHHAAGPVHQRQTSPHNSNVMNKPQHGQHMPTHHNNHHQHHMPNPPSQHHSGHHGGDDFVADPLPFNYDVMEATFDDRYGRNNNSGNVRSLAPPSVNEKPLHHAPQHPQQQHPMRYGSLLSGMQHQHSQQYQDSYNDAAASVPHHQYDTRREQHNLPMNDRPTTKDSYHFMSQHASHPNDHDASVGRLASTSHYSMPDLHSNMGNHGNSMPMYHQSSPAYSTSGPSTSQHSTYSTLMESHHSGSSVSSILPTKKDMPPVYHNDYMDTRPPHHSTHAPLPTSAHMSASLASAQSPQEAVIKVKTSLKNKYWRNGRRNLQCFPSCKVFGDYSQIKIEDLKQHDFMWGKCRGSLIAEVTLNSNATFDDILLLGRVHSLENIPVPFDEAVIRECMIGRVVEPDVMDTMKEQWIQGERLPDFINPNQSITCYEFKPKVWKYTDDMVHGKCKRRNVRYYVQFEAFVPVLSGDRRCFVCIGSGMSSSFEVGSSRVLARQKRKANTGDDDEDDKDSNENFDQNESGNSRRSAKRAANPSNGYSI